MVTLFGLYLIFSGLKKTKVIFPVDYKTVGIITDDVTFPHNLLFPLQLVNRTL